MEKRSGKFYYKNERETMELLGMKQVPGSGSGWVAKEDGENDHVLCQLKSTDAGSIRISKQDIDKLIINSMIERKVPVFAIQFLQSNEVFLLCRPLDLPEMAEFIKTGVSDRKNEQLVELDISNIAAKRRKKPEVKSSEAAREKFRAENSKRWKKKERSAT